MQFVLTKDNNIRGWTGHAPSDLCSCDKYNIVLDYLTLTGRRCLKGHGRP